jgi:GT2 family glycosyltransferase
LGDRQDKMAQALVGVVLINWKRPEEVAQTIENLRAQTYTDLRIYVINNGDKEKLATVLMRSGDFVYDIIEAQRNLGFSGACNLGIQKALADRLDYVWLLNTDTRLSDDCLMHLVEDAEAHPKSGLFSPMLYADVAGYPVWVAGGKFDSHYCYFDWFSSECDAIRQETEAPEKFMLPGTALLIRAVAARAIGPLDDHLFAYHEDVDFNIRSENANIGRRLVSKASVFHRHAPNERLAPHVAYYLSRNSWLLWRKHALQPGVLRKIRWEWATLRRSIRNFAGDRELCDAWRLGWWHGLLNIGGEMRPTPTVPYLLRKLM